MSGTDNEANRELDQEQVEAQKAALARIKKQWDDWLPGDPFPVFSRELIEKIELMIDKREIRVRGAE